MVSRYSVVGLGKLGASMAAAIASRGFEVTGVDVSQAAVDAVNRGQAPVQETGLADLIAANKQRLRATVSHEAAVRDSDVSFVIVPTPSDERGAFSLQYAAWAFREIGRALRTKNGYHLVVLTSTVLPGGTRYGLLPILERESGKRCGVDFGLCYSPEFIALGSVIHDFLNPDFTLVGEVDDRSGATLEKCYSEIMAKPAPCKRMSLENAELTKVALNSFVTTKITFANTLADLCLRIPGGDIDVVTDALGCDRRIGGNYLKGGLGYAGPCFPRDNRALSFIARSIGGQFELAETTDLRNRTMHRDIVDRLKESIPHGATVAVLGLAYKPFSHVIEESQGMLLVKALSGMGARVLCYDPLAAEPARAELAYSALVLDSLPDCLAQAGYVLITTPDPAFKSLRADDFTQRPVTVVDFWRILQCQLQGQDGITYVPYGRSVHDTENAARLGALWDQTWKSLV